MSLDDIAGGIPPETLDDLEALELCRGRPLVAVDCDEVLVEFTAHLARWLETVGHEMRLTRYRLEGSVFRAGEDVPLPFDESLRLIDRFFEEETRSQRPIEGGAEALRHLSATAQVVILTNVPRHGRDDRIANLKALGMDYPVVVNAGGKGRALAWLAREAAAPVAFVDDSAIQIGSAAKHSPESGRVYFTGSPFVRDVMPECTDAHETAANWNEAVIAVERLLARN